MRVRAIFGAICLVVLAASAASACCITVTIDRDVVYDANTVVAARYTGDRTFVVEQVLFSAENENRSRITVPQSKWIYPTMCAPEPVAGQLYLFSEFRGGESDFVIADFDKSAPARDYLKARHYETPRSVVAYVQSYGRGEIDLPSLREWLRNASSRSRSRHALTTILARGFESVIRYSVGSGSCPSRELDDALRPKLMALITAVEPFVVNDDTEADWRASHHMSADDSPEEDAPYWTDYATTLDEQFHAAIDASVEVCASSDVTR